MKTKVRGSITVFATLLFSVLVAFSLALTDGVRVIESSNFMADAIATSVMSAENCYNKEISSDLDLFLYTMSDQDLKELILKGIEDNSTVGNFTGLNMYSTVNIFNMDLAAGWSNCLANVLNTCNHQLGYQMDEEEKYICHTENSFDADVDGLIYSILTDDTLKNAVSDYFSCKNFYQSFYEYVQEQGEVSNDGYNAKFSNHILDWCIGTKQEESDFVKASTDSSIEDDLYAAYMYSGMAEKRQLGFKWYRNVDATVYGSGTYLMGKYDAGVIYIRNYFGCILDGEAGKSGLSGELEYLLFGNRTDKENVSKVLSEVYKLRLYMNLKSLLKSCEEDNENILKNALNESWFDTLYLYNGGAVKWEKDYGDFVTTHTNDIDDVVELAETISLEIDDGELTYKDYLLSMFYLSCYSGQICCAETMYANFLDLLEYSYGVDAKEIKYGSVIYSYYAVQPEDYSKALSTIGKALMTGKVFIRNYNLGGYMYDV